MAPPKSKHLVLAFACIFLVWRFLGKDRSSDKRAAVDQGYAEAAIRNALMASDYGFEAAVAEVDEVCPIEHAIRVDDTGPKQITMFTYLAMYLSPIIAGVHPPTPYEGAAPRLAERERRARRAGPAVRSSISVARRARPQVRRRCPGTST